MHEQVSKELEQVGVYSNPDEMTDSQRLKYLNELMNTENIAVILDDDELDRIIKQVKNDYIEDKATMESWNEAIKHGMKLNEFDMHAKSTPWAESANFKCPRSIAFGLAFGDRATTELLNGQQIAKATIYGNDPNGDKQKRAERLSLVMNWQIQRKMKGWKTNHRKMLYMLPNYGCVFKKQFYNPVTGKAESRMIGYEDFVVSNDTIDGDLKRFTENFDYEPSEVIQRQKSGIWCDFDTSDNNTVKNNGEVSEQYTWIDLDGDGITEPYQVTYQRNGSHIFHIKALYSKDTLYLSGKDTRERLTMAQVSKLNRLANEGSEGIKQNPYSNYKVINADPLHGITKYGYLPDPEGGYLDVGNYYLLSSIIATINKSVNQALNAGELALNGGGILSADWDKESGDLQLGLQEWTKTGIEAAKLAATMLPWPVKEATQVHIAFIEMQIQELNNIASSYDLSQQIGPNTPAASVLAMIMKEESQHGAIIAGIYDSMSEEFNNIKMILMASMGNDEYRNLVDDPEANIRDDLTDENLDVYPNADPESSSRMQRIQKSVAELDTAQIYIAAQQFDKIDPILNNFYKAIGSDLAEILYPEKTEDQLQQEQKAQAEQAQQAQKQADEDREMNKRLTDSLSIDNEANAKLKDVKAVEQQKKTDVEVAKIVVDAELVKEKTETEAVNQDQTIKETREPSK